MSQQQTSATPHKTSLQRLEDVEKAQANLSNLGAVVKTVIMNLQQLSNASNGSKVALENLAKSTDAILSVLVKKGVVTFEEITSERNAQEVQRKKDTEEALIKQGTFVDSLDPVTAESLLVLKQVTEDGNVLTERDFLEINKVTQEIQSAFLGKNVGDTVTVEGTNLEVLRVLEPVKQGQIVDESVSTSGDEQAE